MMAPIKGVEPLSFGRQPNIITVILNRHKIAVFQGLIFPLGLSYLTAKPDGSLLFIVAYFSRLIFEKLVKTSSPREGFLLMTRER